MQNGTDWPHTRKPLSPDSQEPQGKSIYRRMAPFFTLLHSSIITLGWDFMLSPNSNGIGQTLFLTHARLSLQLAGLGMLFGWQESWAESGQVAKAIVISLVFSFRACPLSNLCRSLTSAGRAGDALRLAGVLG